MVFLTRLFPFHCLVNLPKRTLFSLGVLNANGNFSLSEQFLFASWTDVSSLPRASLIARPILFSRQTVAG